MEKIPKQEYTTEFKERAVKHVKEGKLSSEGDFYAEIRASYYAAFEKYIY